MAKKRKLTQEEIDEQIRLSCLFIGSDSVLDDRLIASNGWYDPYGGGRGLLPLVKRF